MSESDAVNGGTPPVQLDEVLQRPLKYAMSDSLRDIEFGLALMLWSGLSWIGRSESASPAYWIAAGILSGSCLYWLPYPFEKLRSLIIYPRRGYVAFEPLYDARTRLLGKGLLAAAISAVVMSNAKFEMERFAGFWPAFVFLGLAIFGKPTKRWPLLLASVVCFGIGFSWYWSVPAEFSNMFWFSWGVVGAVVGLWRMWRFCKANPKPQADGI